MARLYGSAPQGPDVQHEQEVVEQDHDESEQNPEVEGEGDDDDTRQDSFLDDDWLDWLDKEIEKRD